MPKRNSNELDFQLDLTPFISLLSVCICFLLLTVAWFQIGSLTVKQALGGDVSAQSNEEKRSLWVYIEPAARPPEQNAAAKNNAPKGGENSAEQNRKQKVRIKVKKGSKQLYGKIIAVSRGDQSEFKEHIQSLRRRWPDLNQAFILPEKNVLYEEIIKIIDIARQKGILNIGISPI